MEKILTESFNAEARYQPPVHLKKPLFFHWSEESEECRLEIPAGFTYYPPAIPKLFVKTAKLERVHVKDEVWPLYFWLSQNKGKLVHGPYSVRKPMYDWQKKYKRFTPADVVKLVSLAFEAQGIALSTAAKLMLRLGM